MERWWHRLAIALGRSVRETKASMPASEVMSWVAFGQMEPIGDARADLRTGIIAATIANCNAPRKGKPYAPSDFIPTFEPRKPQTWQEQKAALKNFAAMMNARAKPKAGANG